MKKAIIFFLSVLFILIISCKSEVGTLGESIGEREKTALDKIVTGSAGLETSEKDFEEKIIRNAYVSIQSGNVNKAYDNTILLVEKYQGMIINSNISRYEEGEQSQIEIKVLPDNFIKLLDELKTVGEIKSKNISEEDVTEEYYDIKARLKNAQKVQDRLYEILKKANKVEDILKVEKEIERVGENIETLEGKIKYLDSKTDYARLTVTIFSKKVRIIDLGSIGRGFKVAFQFSVQFFFGIIYVIIGLVPLIILVIVLRPVFLWIIKRVRKK